MELSDATRELNLSYHGMVREDALILTEKLRHNTWFTSLNVCGNFFEDVGAVDLAEALKTMALTSIDIGSNHIGDTGSKAIAEALKESPNLVSAHLQYNDIGMDGLIGIADALAINSTLTLLELRGNFIGDIGCQHLGKSLVVNRGLEKLNLSNNGIGDPGLAALADALKINDTLTTLQLCENDIEDTGPLLLALAHNTALTAVDLGEPSAAFVFRSSGSEQQQLALEQALDRNTAFAGRSAAAARVWSISCGAGLLLDVADVVEALLHGGGGGGGGGRHDGLARDALAVQSPLPSAYRAQYMLEHRARAWRKEEERVEREARERREGLAAEARRWEREQALIGQARLRCWGEPAAPEPELRSLGGPSEREATYKN